MTERRRHAAQPVKNTRVKRLARGGVRLVSLGALLAGGTVWTVQNQRAAYANRNQLLTLPVSVVKPLKPTEEAFRIGQFLGQYTRNRGVAFRVADALVREGHEQNISPELLVGVVLTEDPELDPHARSPVGAKGLMQVMPFHSGKWGCKSRDLYDIEANICHGVQILKQAIDEAPNMRVALLRYNGCVRGRNTPDCHTYDDKVLRHAGRTTEAIRLLRTTAAE